MHQGVFVPNLTPRQRCFVQEYLTDLNATQAAIRAGYSKKAAPSQGSRLMKNVEIKKAIEATQVERSERIGVTQDDVIRGLLREAEYREDGSSHSARVAAWSHLGKHLGMFVDRLEQPGRDGGPITAVVNVIIGTESLSASETE